MDTPEILRLNIFSPMVLAFVLGIIATQVKSDLQVPDQVYTIISIYLMLAIGLKGGFDLATTSTRGLIQTFLLTFALGIGIPTWSYFILRRLGAFDVHNAAAIAMHYGAVSAVTVSACVTFLADVGETFEGYMPAMVVVMEIVPLLVGLTIYTTVQSKAPAPVLAFPESHPPDVLEPDLPELPATQTQAEVLRSALTNKSVLLLGGGIVIGYLSGEAGKAQVAPFFITLFPGFLTLFLLEMGTLVGKRLADLPKMGFFLIGFGIVMPIIHATLSIVLGNLIGLSLGGSMMLAIIACSASYIAAPVVVMHNIPKANPGYYLTASLVITFPFNLIIGLPLYLEFARWIY